jgi:hypothetical protein
VGSQVGALILAPLGTVARQMRRRRAFRRVARELNAMSSREVAVKGISRALITRLALEAGWNEQVKE